MANNCVTFINLIVIHKVNSHIQIDECMDEYRYNPHLHYSKTT